MRRYVIVRELPGTGRLSADELCELAKLAELQAATVREVRQLVRPLTANGERS